MRVLIVLAGLLRQWELGFESLRRRVIEVNRNCTFDIALLTDYTNVMSYRDTTLRRSARGSLPANGSQTVRAQLATTLGPNITIVFEQASPQGIPNRDCGKALVGCMSDGAPPGIKRLAPPNNRKPFFELRVAHGIHAIYSQGLLADYDHVLALRFDASITKPLHIKHVCRDFPGVNLIGASWMRVIPGFVHNRDVDLAYLGCNVSGLQTYLYPYFDNNATTRAETRFREAYRRPNEFSEKLSPWHCKPYYGPARYECQSIELMAEEGVRLGTLDNASIFVDLINWAYADTNGNQSAAQIRGLGTVSAADEGSPDVQTTPRPENASPKHGSTEVGPKRAWEDKLQAMLEADPDAQRLYISYLHSLTARVETHQPQFD